MKIKKSLKWWGIGVFVGLLAILILVWYFVIGIQSGYDGRNFNKDNNAVWIGHEWADQVKSDEEISSLVRGLVGHGINTVFVHVGPLEANGRIPVEKFSQVLNFVEKAKMTNPDLKVLAWMGQIRNNINLGDPDVRNGILSMVTLFVDVVGMDGIHYDIEPVWDDDLDFIKLLAETRSLLPDDKILSVALAEFIPNSFVWWTSNLMQLKNYNTETNYLNVAKYADQIVDMVYDTGIRSSWLYEMLVKEQIIWITSMLKNEVANEKTVEFLIGIPAYDKPTEKFDPSVENIESGLSGVMRGLNDLRCADSYFSGIAIYPEWEISEEEWTVFDAVWGGGASTAAKNF